MQNRVERLRRALLATLLMMPFLSDAGLAQSPARVGLVNAVQAEASVVTGDADTKAEIGVPVHLGDEIRTGAGARLAVTFLDNTQLTLGENARLVVDRFVFDPDQAKGDVLFKASKGAFRFVTGRIGELATKTVEVQTPVASIGVRGTEFWGGPIDGAFGVFLLDGVVSVRNQAGETILNAPGLGTTLTSPTVAPGPAVVWAADKVDRAVASVSFQ